MLKIAKKVIKNQLPKPEKEIIPKGSIPLEYIEQRVKDLNKEKIELIKERQKIINETNKKVFELEQKLQQYDGAIREINKLKEVNNKSGNAK